MTEHIADDLLKRAQAAEQNGRAEEAAQAWRELAEHFPRHPAVLFHEGRARLQSGDAAGSVALLIEAEAGDPDNPEVPLLIALAFNKQGAYQDALAALDRALAIDPYFFFALLSKGKVLEQMGRARLAARVYQNALKIAPPPERMPASIRAPYEHAKTLVEQSSHALADHLRARTSQLRSSFSGEDLRRFDECLGVLAGVQKRHVQEPIQLYFPRLPAIPFFEREFFPWLGKLEAATDVIRQEFERVYAEDRTTFGPYMRIPAGAPVNQWRDLNNSPAWSTFFLWRDGKRDDANCARCPDTAALLETLPLCDQQGFAPTAMFSVLAPKTSIPPHTGSSNTRLILHLPLVLPGQCRFRVGNETREWKMGEAWVFDDSIEHEAWNDSDQPRAILIFDVWNPLLSAAERQLVTQMMLAFNEFDSSNPQKFES
jgi:aspartyl/asparaginyl beta-hydroxylase (cupin superfamily)